MSRVLITAFGPYGGWKENASWLALVELTRNLPKSPEITTRLYPVDLHAVQERLLQDLAQGFDYVLHLGQAPGSASIHLENISINVNAASVSDLQQPQPLVQGAPVAYQSDLPLAQWAGLLREAGIPSRVSYYAGTYLCNATLFLTLHLCRSRSWRTRATFLHLPLTCSQTLDGQDEMPSMPSSQVVRAIRLLLSQFTAEAIA